MREEFEAGRICDPFSFEPLPTGVELCELVRITSNMRLCAFETKLRERGDGGVSNRSRIMMGVLGDVNIRGIEAQLIAINQRVKATSVIFDAIDKLDEVDARVLMEDISAVVGGNF